MSTPSTFISRFILLLLVSLSVTPAGAQVIDRIPTIPIDAPTAPEALTREFDPVLRPVIDMLRGAVGLINKSVADPGAYLDDVDKQAIPALEEVGGKLASVGVGFVNASYSVRTELDRLEERRRAAAGTVAATYDRAIAVWKKRLEWIEATRQRFARFRVTYRLLLQTLTETVEVRTLEASMSGILKDINGIVAENGLAALEKELGGILRDLDTSKSGTPQPASVPLTVSGLAYR